MVRCDQHPVAANTNNNALKKKQIRGGKSYDADIMTDHELTECRFGAHEDVRGDDTDWYN